MGLGLIVPSETHAKVPKWLHKRGGACVSCVMREICARCRWYHVHGKWKAELENDQLDRQCDDRPSLQWLVECQASPGDTQRCPS